MRAIVTEDKLEPTCRICSRLTTIQIATQPTVNLQPRLHTYKEKLGQVLYVKVPLVNKYAMETDDPDIASNATD